MKIALFTNTYLPHVGGVARSVQTLEDACRQRGHEVRVIAPEFDGEAESPDVLRVPAIRNFNGSDFSVQLPVPGTIREYIEDFAPDVIHSHHPFLMGDAALRAAWSMRVPIVFTHHTLYERYTHYVPLDSKALRRMVIQLGTEYANLCDHVIAPSGSIARLLRERGVESPIKEIPTGIDVEFFANGNGGQFREKRGIARDARVIGHVGRLAKEKNLLFLAEAITLNLNDDPDAVFLIVGAGADSADMLKILRGNADERQIHAVGELSGTALADAYAAMDCFVFASQSETQGLVLAEAMAAGKPVVALDGPGVREIVADGGNGLMLPGDAAVSVFSSAVGRILNDPELADLCSANARETAGNYSTDRCVGQVIECYEEMIGNYEQVGSKQLSQWDRALLDIEIEWDLLMEKISAASAAVIETQATEARID